MSVLGFQDSSREFQKAPCIRSAKDLGKVIVTTGAERPERANIREGESKKRPAAERAGVSLPPTHASWLSESLGVRIKRARKRNKCAGNSHSRSSSQGS